MKTRKRLLILLLIFLLLNALPVAFGQDIPAKDIVKRSDDLMRGDTQEGKYVMIIITPNWERRLEIYIYSKARDKIFLKILSPAKEKGITTLRVKNEMWNYLPNVERTIKIPPSLMLQPWMGSDFANDDLVKENSVVDDYDHKIIREEIIDGQAVVCIELTPKPRAAVIWDKRIMWINKDNFLPLRDEFYGKKNKLIKSLVYAEPKKISDRVIPKRWEMISAVKEGHRTIIEVDDKLIYNEPIDDDVFSLQNLKKSS